MRPGQGPEPRLRGHSLGTRGHWLREEPRTPKPPVLLMGHLFWGCCFRPGSPATLPPPLPGPRCQGHAQGSGCLFLEPRGSRGFGQRFFPRFHEHHTQLMQGSREGPPRQPLLGWDTQSRGLKLQPDGPLPISVNRVTGAQPGLCPCHPPLSAAAFTLRRRRGLLAEEAGDVHRPALYRRGCQPPMQTPASWPSKHQGWFCFW